MKINNFSKKQKKVLCWWCNNSPYKNWDAIICDGAIRSGKTVCMGLSFVVWAFYYFNKSSFAICGRTISCVKRNLVTPLLDVLNDMGFICKTNFSQNKVTIIHNNKENVFYLFGGKDSSSSSLIQGVTLSGVLFDEVALINHSFVEQAIARCSVTGSKFWFNCNPEYPGHWFYKEWILKSKQKKALYIHFCMQDNPSLTKDIINRYENLYSGIFYERFILGKWVATHGAIYPFMANADAFCERPNKKFSKYIISCDYGIVNPTSFGMWAELDGTWYRIDEYYYDSRKTEKMLTDIEYYEELKKFINGIKIDCIVVDPSAASFITLIKRYGEFNVISAKNDVINGIRETSTALKKGTIRICKNCYDSIREFSLYRWKEGLVDDVPNKENDHAMDDIRYFVSTILQPYDEKFIVFASKRK